MITYDYQFRVAYTDTDQMGTMHHANYVKYYEIARWELFRNMGISYKSIEEAGFMCPVISMNIKYIKTTSYDEQLTIRTQIKAYKGVRIWFNYKIYNDRNELINEAETELAFVDRKNWKPCAIPDFIIDRLCNSV